eukprot:CAMPEP_0183297124 /NCGR_PEP_ID=MMETSP0160_2-20130417/4487_1 /TAXON_ID=2839 ORGANISM="Odontella Sinensis, Strain Grunow 1884" /NCGR_SAMPLE_ID=MMETSP0160_2 /ASSEMBLY_ACC=CAM_ASM_000250 /LENGTH=163 /DNA_ID=CAMNT_0025458875 /DNA_START=404 /DNA_END=892 /DNA_ORIENTATION=-
MGVRATRPPDHDVPRDRVLAPYGGLNHASIFHTAPFIQTFAAIWGARVVGICCGVIAIGGGALLSFPNVPPILHSAIHDGAVPFVACPIFEASPQRDLSWDSLCKDKEPARGQVETMDRPGLGQGAVAVRSGPKGQEQVRPQQRVFVTHDANPLRFHHDGHDP